MATFNGYVIGTSLNLRQTCSTNSTRLTQIPNGTSINVTTVSGQNGWFQTTYNGYTGFVAAQYVAVTSDGGTCRVTISSESLNIRETPSTSAARLYTAAQNAVLRLLDYTSVSGWYRVSGSNGTGWASADYLTIISYPNGGSGGNNGTGGSVNCSGIVCQGNTDDTQDCQVFYNKLTARYGSDNVAKYGFDTTTNSPVGSMANKDNYKSARRYDVLYWSSHGSNTPLLNLGSEYRFDSISAAREANGWLGINNKLKVPILAACRQLDGSENRSAWAQVMRESNIRVICGYHATAPGSADVSVANSFFSYINGGSTGNSVKYSWHHANSSHGNNSTYMVLVYQNDNQCYYRLPGFSSVTYRDPNRTTDSIYAYASFMEGGVRAKNAGTAQQSNEQLPYELKLSKTVRVALPIKDGREASCTIVDPDTGALFLGYGEFPFEQVDVKKAEEQNYKCFEELFGRLLLDEALIKNCKTEMFEVLPDSKEGEHTTLAIASQFVNQYHGITIGDNLIVITTDANGINSISNRWRDVAPVEDTVMLECKRELTPELKKLVEKKIRELGFETEISSCDLIYLENGEKCVLYHEVDLANGERLYVDALTHAITF